MTKFLSFDIFSLFDTSAKSSYFEVRNMKTCCSKQWFEIRTTFDASLLELNDGLVSEWIAEWLMSLADFMKTLAKTAHNFGWEEFFFLY